MLGLSFLEPHPTVVHPHSHRWANPAEDINGFHNSTQVYNPNPGPQAWTLSGEDTLEISSLLLTFHQQYSFEWRFVLFGFTGGRDEGRWRAKERKETKKIECRCYFRSGFWLRLILRAIIFENYERLRLFLKTGTETTVIGAGNYRSLRLAPKNLSWEVRKWTASNQFANTCGNVKHSFSLGHRPTLSRVLYQFSQQRSLFY